MPWSKQNTSISVINKDHFYVKKDINYWSLCGHFMLEEITSNRKAKDKCKICEKIRKKISLYGTKATATGSRKLREFINQQEPLPDDMNKILRDKLYE